MKWWWITRPGRDGSLTCDRLMMQCCMDGGDYWCHSYIYADGSAEVFAQCKQYGKHFKPAYITLYFDNKAAARRAIVELFDLKPENEVK